MANDRDRSGAQAINGEVRVGMRLDLPITTTVPEGVSMLSRAEFPTEEESEELTKLIAKRKRKRVPRVPSGSGT